MILVYYICASLLIGVILTILSSDGEKFDFKNTVNFIGCVLCYAAIWPLIALAILIT